MAHSVYQFLVSTCLTAAQSRSRNTVMPPVAAASVVFMATCAAKAPSLPDFMVNVEPGLKPYQPNLKKNDKKGKHSQSSKRKASTKSGDGIVQLQQGPTRPSTNNRIDLHSGATKPNHQQSARPGNQRAKVPSTTNGRLWHSNSCEIQHVHRKMVGQEARKMGHDGTIEAGNRNPVFTGVAIACNPFFHFQSMGRPSWPNSS